MALVFIGLGTNMGDRIKNILEARRGLARLRDTVLLSNAPVYETRPVGGPAEQQDYYNSACLVETRMQPLELLRELHAVEAALGRDRGVETLRWGPRRMDLDILLWDDLVIEEDGLTVPHPRLAQRAFVLAPLADLDGDLLHPVLDMTVRELLERMDLEHEGIRRLSV